MNNIWTKLQVSDNPDLIQKPERRPVLSQLKIGAIDSWQKMGFLLLCFLALSCPSVAQFAYWLLPEGIGGLSLMQWFQGVVFLVALLLLLRVYRPYRDILYLRRLVFLFAFGISVFLLKSSIDQNTSMETLKSESILYFRFFFVVFIWLFTGLLVRTTNQARMLLACIILGTSVDAIFKIIGLTSGQWVVDTYVSAGVSASFGAEGISGKATVGFLLQSIFLSWYLLKNRPWRAAALSLLFLVAVCVAHGRAGQVVLCLSLLWCLIWVLFLSPRYKFKGVFVRFLILSVIAGWILVANYSIETFTARWTYELHKKGTVTGSGRLDFYTTTWEWFRSVDGLDLLLGQGQERTYDMIDRATGVRVHTHSDLFDMMSYGGVLGLLLYAYLVYALFRLLRGIPYFCFEFQIAGAIGISFLMMSLITGQMGATHAMFMLGAVLWCLRLLVVTDARVPMPGRLTSVTG